VLFSKALKIIKTPSKCISELSGGWQRSAEAPKTMTTPNFSPSKHENIRKNAVLAEKCTNMKAQPNKPLMPINSPFNRRYFSVVLHSNDVQLQPHPFFLQLSS
jgi:hypothetical protein